MLESSAYQDSVTAPLESMLGQVPPAHRDDPALLAAGFGVLAKDYAAYLQVNPRPDAEMFERIFGEFAKEEVASYGGSPYYQPAEQTGLPMYFAQDAARGNFDVSPLCDPQIEHEWTSIPGKKLFIRFAKEFRGVICGPGGPHELFEKGLLGQQGLPTALASSILVTGFSGAAFWAPLALYIALLVIKSGLNTYCATGEAKVELEPVG